MNKPQPAIVVVAAVIVVVIVVAILVIRQYNIVQHNNDENQCLPHLFLSSLNLICGTKPGDTRLVTKIVVCSGRKPTSRTSLILHLKSVSTSPNQLAYSINYCWLLFPSLIFFSFQNLSGKDKESGTNIWMLLCQIMTLRIKFLENVRPITLWIILNGQKYTFPIPLTS